MVTGLELKSMIVHPEDDIVLSFIRPKLSFGLSAVKKILPLLVRNVLLADVRNTTFLSVANTFTVAAVLTVDNYSTWYEYV